MSDPARGTVLLIDPPGWQGLARAGTAYPNVGLAYLASALAASGFRSVILDLNNKPQTDVEVLTAVQESAPLFVGLSIKTATLDAASKLAMLLKRGYPEIPVFAGGTHAGIAPEELDKAAWLDGFLSGEGERILPTLCQRLSQGENAPRRLSELEIKSGGFGYCLVDDLDSLTFPDYSLFPEPVRAAVSRSYPLVTSRGCPYGCTYCSVPLLGRHRWRSRAPEALLEELRHARNKYSITGFEIIDDAFNLDMKRCKTFCRLLTESGLDLEWNCYNGLRADRMDEELARLMAQAHCRSVMVGVESGDPAVFGGINKGETLEDVERGIGLMQQAGITVGGYFILGLPGDSFAATERSLEFARRLGIHPHFNLLIPYPGTKLWDWFAIHGRQLVPLSTARHFGADRGAAPVFPFETADFPEKERRRAWKLIQVRTGQMHLLVPPGVSRFSARWHRARLLWTYNRTAFWHRVSDFLLHSFSGLFFRVRRK